MNREIYNFSFRDLIIADKGKNKFLESVNQIIDWNKIKKLINKYNKKGASADGFCCKKLRIIKQEIIISKYILIYTVTSIISFTNLN